MSIEIEELNCKICLYPLSEVVTLICGHNFCSPCIKNWLIETRSCPLCKEKIEDRKFYINVLLSNIISYLFNDELDFKSNTKRKLNNQDDEYNINNNINNNNNNNNINKSIKIEEKDIIKSEDSSDQLSPLSPLSPLSMELFSLEFPLASKSEMLLDKMNKPIISSKNHNFSINNGEDKLPNIINDKYQCPLAHSYQTKYMINDVYLHDKLCDRCKLNHKIYSKLNDAFCDKCRNTLDISYKRKTPDSTKRYSYCDEKKPCQSCKSYGLFNSSKRCDFITCNSHYYK
jgi:hypothetical protein